MVLYTDAEVRSKVTHHRVLNKIPREKQLLLDEPLAAGDGLTDQTYGDWIVNKSRRLFLALDNVGCPERIFDIADKFIEDSDLPLRPEDISKLGFEHQGQEKKFYRRQFDYLAQELRKGSDHSVEEESVVSVNVLPNNSPVETADRVRVGQWELSRWLIPLNSKDQRERSDFTMHYKALQELRHPHLVKVVATSIQKGHGSVLINPYEMSLRSFLEEPSSDFKEKSRTDQLDLLLLWIRCLLGVVAYLHESGLGHGAIRPSNIFVTANSTIFLGPHLGPFAPPEKCPEIAQNAYLAPEQWTSQVVLRNKRLSLHRRAKSVPRLTHVRRPSQASLRTLPPHGVLAPPASMKSRQLSADAVISPHLPLSRFQKESPKAPLSTNLESKPLPPSPRSRASPAHISDQYAPEAGHRRRTSSASSTTLSAAMQSDIFSLSTVIVEILSLFASISRSSNKFSASFLHAHLEKNRGPSRKGDDPSFQSSLFQVHTWLDSLIEIPDAKPRKKLPRLLTNMNGTKIGSDDHDPSQYLGVTSSLVSLVRRGIERSPALRFAASDGFAQADEVLRNWGIPASCTCSEPVRLRPPPTPFTPASTISPLSARRETQVVDGGYFPSPLATPNVKAHFSPINATSPVPPIPAALLPMSPARLGEKQSLVPTLLSPVTPAIAKPIMDRSSSVALRASTKAVAKPTVPNPNLLSPLRSPNPVRDLKPDTPVAQMPAPEATAPVSKLNMILGLAASRPATPPSRSDSPPLPSKSLAPLLIPINSPQNPILMGSSPCPSSVPNTKSSPNLQAQQQPQLAELPCAESMSLSSSSCSDTSSAEDPCWLPPTPTSTLFHPTVYALAAAAWDEDPVEDPPIVQSLSLESLTRRDSEIALSPTAVPTPKSPHIPFDDEKEVFLPLHPSPGETLDEHNEFILPIHNHSNAVLINDDASSIYSTDEVTSPIYSDDGEESVIIALDAYVLPRPLQVSRQSRNSKGSLNRISSQHHPRRSGSVGLRRSRSWSNLGTGLGAKVGMGAGEDEGRARFRSRWEERLARKGTVTVMKPNPLFELGAIERGPKTGPATVATMGMRLEDPLPAIPRQQKFNTVEAEQQQIAQNGRQPKWWGNEWGNPRRESLGLQRKRTVRRESVWIQERRERERQSIIRLGSV